MAVIHLVAADARATECCGIEISKLPIPDGITWERREATCHPRLRDVVCPQCSKAFRLVWNDYSNQPQTLIFRGCPSGGIYDVRISCPHCDYEEEL